MKSRAAPSSIRSLTFPFVAELIRTRCYTVHPEIREHRPALAAGSVKHATT